MFKEFIQTAVGSSLESNSEVPTEIQHVHMHIALPYSCITQHLPEGKQVSLISEAKTPWAMAGTAFYSTPITLIISFPFHH